MRCTPMYDVGIWLTSPRSLDVCAVYAPPGGACLWYVGLIVCSLDIAISALPFENLLFCCFSNHLSIYVRNGVLIQLHRVETRYSSQTVRHCSTTVLGYVVDKIISVGWKG